MKSGNPNWKYSLHVGYDCYDIFVGDFEGCLQALRDLFGQFGLPLDNWARWSLGMYNDDMVDYDTNGLTEEESDQFESLLHECTQGYLLPNGRRETKTG
jgi:hypothetical protein